MRSFDPAAMPIAEASFRSFPKAALFDLDGTLIDSVPDITEAVAELMATENLVRFDEASIRVMVGYGLRVLVQRAFGARGIELDDEGLRLMTQRMETIYPRHLTSRTTLLPGVVECLSQLAAEGCAIGLVTNKMQGAADIVLRHFGLTERFAVVLGDQMRPVGLRPKPSSDMLDFALARLEVKPADAIMVGDSAADIQSAATARIFSVAVRNGYSSVPLETLNPGAIIADLTALPAAIEAWRHG
jgi:phosphoglycolate phosphatase